MTLPLHALIVEDEPTLGQQLKSTLEQTGYAVDLSTDGEDGHFLGMTEDYDAVILDLEDSVPLASKAEARALVAKYFGGLAPRLPVDRLLTRSMSLPGAMRRQMAKMMAKRPAR